MWNRIYNSIRLAIPVFLLCIALFSFNVNSTNASNFFTNKISTVEGVNNFVASIYDTILNLFVKKTKEVYVPVPVYISDTITTPVSEVVVDDATKIYNNNLLSIGTQKEFVSNNVLNVSSRENSNSNDGKEYVEMEFFQNQVETIFNSIYNSTTANIDSHTETEIHGGGSSGISFATVDLGGTGISTVPNYGELLMGDGLGGYSLVATSSLGLLGGGGSSQWTTNGSDIYYTTGSVGIGTTTPSTGIAGKLVVEQTHDAHTAVRILNLSDTPNAYAELAVRAANVSTYIGSTPQNSSVTSGAGSAGRGYIWSQSTGVNRGLDLVAASPSSDLRFFTGGYGASSERIRITSTGDVGIGTTSPNAKLSIYSGAAGIYSVNAAADELVLENSGSGGMSIVTPDASTGNIFFGSPSRQIGSQLSWNYNNLLMTIGTGMAGGQVQILAGNAAEAMRINSSGNVGIGTTTPGANLDVNGTTRLGGLTVGVYPALVLNNKRADAAGIGTGLQFKNRNDASNYMGGIQTIYRGGITSALTMMDFFAGGDSVTPKMTLSGSGSLGIGTTTPGNLLSLYKSTGSLISSIQSNGTAWAGIKISDLTDPMTYWNSGSNFRWGVTTANDGVTGFSEYMRISSTGNLGIGTTSPYKKLAIADASPAIVLSSTNTNISMGATYGDIDFTSDDLSGAGLMARIRAKANDNNFGGDADITFWTRAGGAEMLEKMRLTSFGGLSVGSTTGAAMLTVENITTRNSFVVSDQALDPTPFVIDNSGNVGIGTSSPAVRLQIGSGYANFDNSYGLTFANAGATDRDIARILYSPSGTLDFYNADAVRMTVGYGGNIGIGTTSPTALLSLGNGSGSPGTTPALGINFGDPTANLYRLASGMIRTDGALAVGGNLNMYYGNQLLINKAGNNWLNFATRDTTGPEAVYNLSSIGTITTSNTSAISTIAGPLIARSLLYPNGEVLSATSSWAIGYTGSSTLFYPNNMPLATADGTLYYGDSNILATKGDGLFLSAKIYYPNNNVLVDGTSLYYPAGSTPITDATGNLYYSNGNTFVDSLGSIYDMNSNTLLFDATNLFLRERLVSSDGTGGITITNSPGYVGISSTTPWRNLSVDGTVAMNGLTSSATGNALCITSAKELTDSGGASCTPSSIRFKENVTTLNPGYAMDTLSKLKVVHFDYKEKQPYETNHSYGLIAEEVANIDNNLVDYGYDGLPVSLHFEKITGLLVQAVQEQKAQIEEIKSQAFLDKIIKGVTDSFASVVVRMQTAFVGELHVQEKLCVDDVCINKDQLKIILMNSGGTRYIPDTNPQPIIINNNNTNTDATSSTTEETTPPQASTTPQVQTPIEQPNTEPTNTPEQTPTVPPVEPVVEVTTPNPEPVEPTPVESAPEPEPAPISSPEPAPTEGQ